MKNMLLVVIILLIVVLIDYLFKLLFSKEINMEIALIACYSFMLLDEIDKFSKLRR